MLSFAGSSGRLAGGSSVSSPAASERRRHARSTAGEVAALGVAAAGALERVCSRPRHEQSIRSLDPLPATVFRSTRCNRRIECLRDAVSLPHDASRPLQPRRGSTLWRWLLESLITLAIFPAVEAFARSPTQVQGGGEAALRRVLRAGCKPSASKTSSIFRPRARAGIASRVRAYCPVVSATAHEEDAVKKATNQLFLQLGHRASTQYAPQPWPTTSKPGSPTPSTPSPASPRPV